MTRFPATRFTGTEEEPVKIFLMKILHAHYFEMKKRKEETRKTKDAE